MSALYNTCPDTLNSVICEGICSSVPNSFLDTAFYSARTDGLMPVVDSCYCKRIVSGRRPVCGGELTYLDPYEDLHFGWESLCTFLWNFTLRGCDYVIPITGSPTSPPTFPEQDVSFPYFTLMLLGIVLLSCSGCTVLKCICCQDDYESCCDCCEEEEDSSTEVEMAREEWIAQEDGEPDGIVQEDESSSLSKSIPDLEGEPPKGEQVYIELSPLEGELSPGLQELEVRPLYNETEESESFPHRVLAPGEISYDSRSITHDCIEGD